MSDNNSSNVPDEEQAPNYKVPEQKSLEEILKLNQEDESLKKYKERLLGSCLPVAPFPSDPRNVIFDNLTLQGEGRDPIVMKLANPKALSDLTYRMKDSAQYRLQFNFYIQREIVSGLKYVYKLTKLGIPIYKEVLMIGSYPPKQEMITFDGPLEDSPKTLGIMTRGKYRVKSKIVDDYNHCYLEWTWNIDIEKDW